MLAVNGIICYNKKNGATAGGRANHGGYMTLRTVAERLRACGIENARAEARMLVAHVTGIPEEILLCEADSELPDPEGELERLLTARQRREPLQYLLGEWGFLRQTYEVSPDCLIPRPETERLVEIAAEELPRGARVMDLCTGSGCVAISLLCERKDLSAVAVDLFDNTLEIARRNAVRNGVGSDRLTFVRGDVLTADFLPQLGRFDAVLSNPPYIPHRVIPTLEPELAFEPIAALDGGEDGLCFYRRILTGSDYREALCRHGRDGTFYFEIGYDQGNALRELARACGGHCRILKDLNGNDRVAVITPPHTLTGEEIFSDGKKEN